MTAKLFATSIIIQFTEPQVGGSHTAYERMNCFHSLLETKQPLAFKDCTGRVSQEQEPWRRLGSSTTRYFIECNKCFTMRTLVAARSFLGRVGKSRVCSSVAGSLPISIPSTPMTCMLSSFNASGEPSSSTSF